MLIIFVTTTVKKVKEQITLLGTAQRSFFPTHLVTYKLILFTQYTYLGANEQHGCPYKHYSDARLEAILRMKLKIPNENIREILDKKRGGHVQVSN